MIEHEAVLTVRVGEQMRTVNLLLSNCQIDTRSSELHFIKIEGVVTRMDIEDVNHIQELFGSLGSRKLNLKS